MDSQDLQKGLLEVLSVPKRRPGLRRAWVIARGGSEGMWPFVSVAQVDVGVECVQRWEVLCGEDPREPVV